MKMKCIVSAGELTSGLLFAVILFLITSCGTDNVTEPDNTIIGDTTGKIAFVSNREGNDDEIWIMNSDGSDRVNLTDNDIRDLDPDFSPDGNKIVYASKLYDDDFEIHVFDLTTNNITRLTNDPSRDYAPAWSPDGTKIAFASRRSGEMNIWIMNADGSGKQQITFENTENYDFQPSWSPDGTKIVYESMRNIYSQTTIPFLVIINTDGTNETVITEGLNPDWSPDGSKIAYTGVFNGNYEIAVCYTDGSNITRLTNWDDADLDPAWSPDGSKIAFARKIGGLREVYLMDSDGSNQERITYRLSSLEESNWFPCWSPLSGNRK